MVVLFKLEFELCLVTKVELLTELIMPSFCCPMVLVAADF